VDEDDWMTVGRLDLVRADSLGDAAGLARRDAGLSDRVQDGRLPVIDVAEDGDDWRPRHELAWILVGEGEELLAGRRDDIAFAFGRLDRDDVLAGDGVHREPELVGDDLRRGEVDDLVDGGQD